MIKEKSVALKQKSDFERFCSFDALCQASYKVCRNVRWKDSTINFEESRIETILDTEAKLRANEYQQLLFSCFDIIERGKLREIRACHIGDRLVQNALCDQVLIPQLVPKFIRDNCATLKDRGIDYALNRAKKHLQSARREYQSDFYALRIDIKQYFDSIDHEKLKSTAKQVIKDPNVYELVCYLIDTFSFKVTHDTEPQEDKDYYIQTGSYNYKLVHPQTFKERTKYFEYAPKSLGLGSQTSQLFALLALNEVDHYAKEKLHLKYYGRYMNDIYILHNDKKYLEKCREKLEQKLNENNLQMNKKKTTIVKIQLVKSGRVKHAPFKYLKWNFYITETGKIIQLPFKNKITKERKKLRKLALLWQESKVSSYDIQEHYRGWRAHMEKGTTFYVIQKMDNYFRQLFKGVDIV